jgi:hypothetical protein
MSFEMQVMKVCGERNIDIFANGLFWGLKWDLGEVYAHHHPMWTTTTKGLGFRLVNPNH